MNDRRRVYAALVLAALAIGIAGCGGDDDDETTAQEPANANAQSNIPDLGPFLMHNDEEPGFSPASAPDQIPHSGGGTTGVEAFVQEMNLTPADARRLRSEGFIAFSAQPIRGPRNTAGITNVALFATAKGAQHNMAHELQPDVVRSAGPVKKLHYFKASGIPGARGWTASEPHVGNLWWVQGRCVLVLGNQGPGPFEGPLSEGARAIYKRTDGRCP